MNKEIICLRHLIAISVSIIVIGCFKTKDQSGTNLNVPDYYKEHITQKESAIQAKEQAYDLNGDSFIFLTDFHIETNYCHSPSLVKHILDNTNVKKLFIGGDLYDWEPKDIAMEYVRKVLKMFDFTTVYITIGNHDVNTTAASPDLYFTEAEIYSLMMEPLESVVNLENRFYYYLDNTSQKIRYFFLDCHWSSNPDHAGRDFHYDEQLEWLWNSASELGSEWSIVVIQHIVFANSEKVDNIPVKVYKGPLTVELVNVLDTMCDDENMPTVIGIIGGHTHYDWYEYSQKGYPIIVTTCDAAWGYKDNQDSRWSDNRIKGSTSEQAFDVFSIDKNNRKIYATRIGFGSDREFSY